MKEFFEGENQGFEEGAECMMKCMAGEKEWMFGKQGKAGMFGKEGMRGKRGEKDECMETAEKLCGACEKEENAQECWAKCKEEHEAEISAACEHDKKGILGKGLMLGMHEGAECMMKCMAGEKEWMFGKQGKAGMFSKKGEGMRGKRGEKDECMETAEKLCGACEKEENAQECWAKCKEEHEVAISA